MRSPDAATSNPIIPGRAFPGPSFRDAPLGAGPESILRESGERTWIPGSRERAPRNDGGKHCRRAA
ncbi:hypothetical protein ABTB64_19695, partial [Acinetobacter baumannii]